MCENMKLEVMAQFLFYHILVLGGVYMEVDPRSHISVNLNSLSKFIFVYMRRASPPWRYLAIDYPRSHLGGLEIFHDINALKRAQASRTHDNLVCLGQHFFG